MALNVLNTTAQLSGKTLLTEEGNWTVTGTHTYSTNPVFSGSFASDVTFADNVNLTFGTGGDADIDYDGTDLVISPRVVGSGNVKISSGNLELKTDDGAVIFGAGEDASIFYDGTDMKLAPALVGTGEVKITGGGLAVSATERVYLDGGSHSYIHESAADTVQIVSGGTATFTTGVSGPHAIGGAVANNHRMRVLGSFTSGGAGNTLAGFANVGALTGASGDTTYHAGALFNTSVTTSGASEAVTTVAQVYIAEPQITIGTATVTNSASLYVAGAASEATNDYAIWVDAGNVLFDANLNVGGTITGSGSGITGVPIASGVSGLGSNVATFLGTPSSANLRSALTDETGSGSACFATSPTLVTPALGTPASGVLTNCTGLPVGALADGTDGQLITWGADAGATTVAVGTAGHALVSSGAGAAPTFKHTGSNALAEGRLTLTSGTSVTTADVSGATTLYYALHNGNQISLYSGSAWVDRTFAQLSISLSGLTASKPYDVFIYDNSGTAALELLVWTNTTTRATALVAQDGVLVKSGATTRRYVGTVFIDSGGGAVTDSLAGGRHVWNMYNRAARPMQVQEATASWTYATAGWRQVRATTTNQLSMVVGVSEDAVSASAVLTGEGTSGNFIQTGIGLDSTSSSTTNLQFSKVRHDTLNYAKTHVAEVLVYPGVGQHTLVWLEWTTGSGGHTLSGRSTSHPPVQSGIQGVIWG